MASFLAGAGHASHHKKHQREKGFPLYAPAQGTRCLVREGDQPRTQVGTVWVSASLERPRALFPQTSSVPAEPFVGPLLHCLLVFLVYLSFPDTQVDLE